MEAAEETLTYRDDTLLNRKLLPEDKHGYKADSKGHATETKSDESNYVDLDMKPNSATTGEVTLTGEDKQLPVIKCDSSNHGEHEKEGLIISEYCVEEQLEDRRATFPGPALIKLPNTDRDSEKEQQRQAELDNSDHVFSESDELQYTDMYLNSKSESDDGASTVLSDHCSSDTVEDESHYITTHEIQLTELDHDVDYDLGRGTCWDFEDDNLVFSFVDYASFESDETQKGTLILKGRGPAKVQSNLVGEVVSTEQEDSDLCDSDKCASSDESLCKKHIGDANAGGIHVSIKTSSRTVNEPVSISDNNTCGYTKHFGEGSHFSFVSSGVRAGPFSDGAQYFIPAPGRQHLASKLRRKDINEYSSGGSSSISELDDADKEVRNLTAKSFRSLACPYFDAINLRTSSESSMSEYGLNNWSAFVDLKCGNISRGGEQRVIETSSTTLEMNNTVGSKRHGKSITGMKAPQNKMSALNKRSTSQQSSSSSKKVEVHDPDQPKQRGVTLNFRCNVETPEGARRPKGSKKARSNEFTGAVLARSGSEMQYLNSDSTGGAHKRAVFASSLLKNVISKKMQFEQERKMERGEISDAHPALSPSFQFKDHDGMKNRGQGRGLERQESESGSGFTVNSDDQCLEGSRPSSCEPAEKQKSSNAPDDLQKVQHKPTNAVFVRSESSAFNSLKEDEPEPVKEAEPTFLTDKQTTTKGLDTSSMRTKLLFVPSCQLLSKEKDFTENLPIRAHVTGALAGPQTCEKELKTGKNGNIGKEENEKGGKNPGIKICLRSVKEHIGCTLNIANLLTPKISLNTFKVAGDAKCHALSASDKIPNFTVRDIRDTKCRFQMPIYQVRDVRKLVKSSYRFVSLDKSEKTAEKLEVTKAPVKHVLPSPIVIKCHSVKTNVKQQTAEAGISSKTFQSEYKPPQCTASRVPLVALKQLHADRSDNQPNIETKLTKQRQEKFACEMTERRNEPKIPKQAALEKLKAAVKTMEQLYVFDRNEWKRKSQAPQPITDSHVLSLIASEEQRAEEITNTNRVPQSQDTKGALNIIHVPYSNDTFKTQSQQSKTFSNKRVLHFGNKARIGISSVSDPLAQSATLQTSSTMKSSRTPVAPLSVKIEPPKDSQVEQGKVKIIPTNPTVAQACSDSENYLTIPGYTNEIKLLNRDPVSREVSSNVSQIKTGDRKTPEQKISPLIMEYPASSICHQTQPHVLCFSPSFPSVSPTLSSGEAAPQTQCKMLLDPTTGHYYLVDTPIQATTKRLFDPETGQYVDVPMSRSSVAPVTPLPLSLSPLTLSAGAYAPTYMIYPGFISPTLQAQAVLSQSPCHSEDAGGERAKNVRSPKPDKNAAGAESAYYSATGETTQGPLQLPVSLGHVTGRGGAASSDRKPVISLTTQQGPRIIAPPSYDGTTMSFVVEHR